MARIDSRTLTLAACAICPAVVIGVWLVFPIWAPSWRAEFGQSLSTVMLAYSGSGILTTLMMPVVGRLLMRIPAWRLITVGAVLMGVGGLVAISLPNFIAFSVAYVVSMGVGVALAGVLPCQALAVRLFPRHVGAIGGLIMIAMAAIGVVLPLVLTPLKAEIGWRACFGGLSVAVLVLIPLLAFLFMREPAAAAAEGAAPDAPAKVAASTGDLLRTAAFWLILAGILPLMAAPTAVQANLLPILADHGINAGEAGLVLAALAIGAALGAVLFGWLADRLDPRLVILGSAALMAVALVVLAGGGGFAPSAAAVVALGMSSGGTLPLLSTFAFRQFGDSYAPAFGLLNSFALPYTFAPPLAGYVRDHTGSYDMVLLVSAPVLVLGAAAMWRLKSTPAPDGKPALHAAA